MIATLTPTIITVLIGLFIAFISFAIDYESSLVHVQHHRMGSSVWTSRGCVTEVVTVMTGVTRPSVGASVAAATSPVVTAPAWTLGADVTDTGTAPGARMRPGVGSIGARTGRSSVSGERSTQQGE